MQGVLGLTPPSGFRNAGNQKEKEGKNQENDYLFPDSQNGTGT